MRMIIASAVLALALAAFGWGLNMLGITEPAIGLALIGVGVILLIISVVIFAWPVLQRAAYNKIFQAFVPFRDVARRVYEETSDTFAGASVEYSSDSPDDVLNDYGVGCIKKGLPIFGKRPPSERLEEIAEAWNLQVKNGARELWGSNPSRLSWGSLRVRKKDEKRLWDSLIDDYRDEGDFASPNDRGPNHD